MLELKGEYKKLSGKEYKPLSGVGSKGDSKKKDKAAQKKEEKPAKVKVAENGDDGKTASKKQTRFFVYFF